MKEERYQVPTTANYVFIVGFSKIPMCKVSLSQDTECKQNMCALPLPPHKTVWDRYQASLKREIFSTKQHTAASTRANKQISINSFTMFTTWHIWVSLLYVLQSLMVWSWWVVKGRWELFMLWSNPSFFFFVWNSTRMPKKRVNFLFVF